MRDLAEEFYIMRIWPLATGWGLELDEVVDGLHPIEMEGVASERLLLVVATCQGYF